MEITPSCGSILVEPQHVACLLALPISAIVANSAAIEVAGTTLPTVDGVFLPATLVDAFTIGNFNKVPMIEGSNQHEYSLLSAVTIDVMLGHRSMRANIRAISTAPLARASAQ
jgi:carboxylesterase type B